MTLNYLEFPTLIKNAIIEVSSDKRVKISIIEEEDVEDINIINKFIQFEIFDNAFGVPNESSFRLNFENGKDFLAITRELLTQMVKNWGGYLEKNIISCPCNLRGRIATTLQQFADDLPCLVYIEKVGIRRMVNCSSLIGILSLGICKGDEIKIIISDGNFEENFNKIVDFFKNYK